MKRVLIKSYVEPAEKEAIEKMADRLGLTVSEFTRRVVTAARIPAPRNETQIRELIGLRADLARLGNLFKMGLDDPDGIVRPGKTVNDLIEDLRQMKDDLAEKIEAL